MVPTDTPTALSTAPTRAGGGDTKQMFDPLLGRPFGSAKGNALPTSCVRTVYCNRFVLMQAGSPGQVILPPLPAIHACERNWITVPSAVSRKASTLVAAHDWSAGTA